MSTDEIVKGVSLIEDKIREIFSISGKDVESIRWNVARGGELCDYESHSIHISVNGKELTLANVPKEDIEDYPGGVGCEVLNTNLNQLVKNF